MVSSNVCVIVARPVLEPSATILVLVAAEPSVPGAEILIREEGRLLACGSLLMLCILACPMFPSVAKSHTRYRRRSSCKVPTGGSNGSEQKNCNNLTTTMAESPFG